MPALKAGRYELQEELGRGAMGVVYRAFDPMIGRIVAVKTMRLAEEGTGMPRPELLTRFQTEARAAGQLVHPNIIVIYDAGETEGLYYITMEYVDGRSLQSLIDQKQPFPLPRILRIMGQVCSALEFAHQRNVVHRDVKPANIVLAADDTVKITDFGTAKILQLGTTQSGTIVGTPSYMSPEQIKGKPIDGRSDVFSLGVILYELVTGEKPFPGESITTVIYKIVNEEPIPPRELDSSVHPGLSAVITKALAKEPDQRYQTCKELMQDLLNYRALAGANVPSGFEATVVVVGQRSPAGAPPSAPKVSGTGTLAGVPSLPTPPGGARSPAASGSLARPLNGQAGAPRPLPGTSTLPSLTAVPEVFAEEPSRTRSRPGLVAILIVLLAIGGYLIWPTLRDIFLRPQATETAQPAGEAAQPATKVPATPTLAPKSPALKTEEAGLKEPKAEPKAAAPSKKGEAPAPALSKMDSAQLLARIENLLRRAGFAGRVKAEINGNTVKFSGTLTPRERLRFQQQLNRRALPAGLSIDYAFASPAPSGEESTDLRPRTAPGKGEVEVITDATGAMATLTWPDGKSDSKPTPYRFEDLSPGRYTLEVKKDGYRVERRIAQVTAGNIKTFNINLQPTLAQLEITTRPPGAEIFLNGKRLALPTPATIPVSPGSYKVGLQKHGYAPYESTVEISADQELKKLSVELGEQAKGIGWVDVKSVPPNADILIDSTNTGYKTPARLELPAGTYTLTIFLRGYVRLEERITVVTGQTQQVNRTLSR
jgi:serine/threonine-protein kinase